MRNKPLWPTIRYQYHLQLCVLILFLLLAVQYDKYLTFNVLSLQQPPHNTLSTRILWKKLAVKGGIFSMRIPQNDVTLGNSNTKNLNLQDSSEINSSYRSNPSFESLEKHNIFHQLSEIFPYENQLKLIKILDECKWSMEEAVLRLIDQSNHPESNDSISNNVPHFDGEMKARSYSPRPSKRFVTVSLPSGFLEAPRVRTVLVPPLPHLAFDYQEYKVYYNRKGRSLDLNVKLIDRTVRVYGLLSSPDGGKGLSELAGVEVGDILYGINHQYFNTDVTLKDITTILSQCGCYVCLHFIRFHPDSMSIVVNGQIRRAGQLRKIHPCALSLIDQGVLRVDEIESFCENMSRLKSRIFSWSSGIITSRQKIADLQAVAQGEVFDSYSRDDPHQRSSKYEKLTKRRHSSHFSGSSNMSKYSQPNLSSDSIASDITKNWYRDIDLMTVNIQPALCIRIMDNRFVGDHVEYRIWVEDISTGLEWFVRRRFKQFYQLREVWMFS